MDDDMKSVEIVFAQRLASGEPTVRQRAIKHLREHISNVSMKITEDSLERLWKGLHYAMWMQDKMLLQEELANEICALLGLFCTDEQKLAFVRVMFFTLSKEWPCIDRWRMDKFLMLMRRMIRTLFSRLSESNWDPRTLDKYMEMFRQTLLICGNSNICEALKYHCASIWLDELDNSNSNGKIMDKDCSLFFIKPYAQLLQERISDTYFRSICSDIFDSLLCDFEERLLEGESLNLSSKERVSEAQDEVEQISAQKGLEFDYKRIAELLFDSGKQQNLASKRRKRIYALCKKFECAAEGLDPFPPVNDVISRKRIRRRKAKG